MILDLSYTEGSSYSNVLQSESIPTFKLEPLIFPFLNILGVFINERNGNEVAVIVENDKFLDSTYRRIIKGYDHRVLVMNAEQDLVKRMRLLRPIPAYFSVVASTKGIDSIIKMVSYC